MTIGQQSWALSHGFFVLKNLLILNRKNGGYLLVIWPLSGRYLPDI